MSAPMHTSWPDGSPVSSSSNSSSSSRPASASPLMSPSSNQALQRSMASPTTTSIAFNTFPALPSAVAANATAAASPSPYNGGHIGSGVVNHSATSSASSSPPLSLSASPSSSSGAGGGAGSSGGSMSLGMLDSTLAKRGAAAKSAASASSSSASSSSTSSAAAASSRGPSLSPSPPPRGSRRTAASSSSSLRPSSSSFAAAGEGLSDSDEEHEGLLRADELSIEAYMRRHPCVLDRGSAFLERHPRIYQMGVIAATVGGTACATMAAFTMQLSSLHIASAYAFVALNLVLFAYACLRPPGKPPQCRDEASVIQLLHGWPASSHHYGLHASEWARSWSFCAECANWRPARAHHCSTCKQCVLLMDHHCVWIGQCVGANNFRHFCAYVLSVFTLSIYALGLCWQYVLHPSASLFLFLSILLVALGGAALGGYLVLRLALLLWRNETGIESLKKSAWKEDQARIKARKQNTPKQQQQQEQQRYNTKERMLIDAGNGSGSSSAHQDDMAESPSSSPSSAARYFSPFQCACHADSFRVLYCSSFNYPALTSSAAPIPPLPYYHDFDTGDGQMNAYLFAEDLRRMEKLHAWVAQGAPPVKVAKRHMKTSSTTKKGSNAATAAATTATMNAQAQAEAGSDAAQQDAPRDHRVEVQH